METTKAFDFPLTHLDVLVEQMELVELLQDVVGLPPLHLLRPHRAQGEPRRLQRGGGRDMFIR